MVVCGRELYFALGIVVCSCVWLPAVASCGLRMGVVVCGREWLSVVESGSLQREWKSAIGSGILY